MPITIRCPNCEATLRVKDELAGRRGRCPRCGAVMQVRARRRVAPASGQAAAAQDDASQTTKPKAVDTLSASQGASQHSVWRDPVEDDSKAPPGVDHRNAEPATPTRGQSPAAPQASHVSDSRVSRYTAKHKRRFTVRMRTWFALAAVVVVTTVAVLGYQLWQRRNATLATSGGSEEIAGVGGTAHSDGGQRSSSVGGDGGAFLEDVYATVEQGIVKIETFDDSHDRQALGTGFLVDSEGLVATSYHVVAYASEVEIEFSNGDRHAVEGYAAIMPERDLALLKLDRRPEKFHVLVLRDEEVPRKASSVFAVGHPFDHEFSLTTGIVSGIYRTAELPDDSQMFLEARLSDVADNLWIQHDAKLSSGNSGGPLINSAGEVVGINSWVNQETGLGYALHANHLEELKKQRLDRIAPLEEYRLRDPATAPSIEPVTPPQHSPAELVEEASRFDWHPRSADDYGVLQELALGVVAARYTPSGQPAPGGAPSVDANLRRREAELAIDELAEFSWRRVPQVESINRYALDALDSPGEGLFLFGTVERIFEGSDGQRGALVKVIGADRDIFIPLDRSLEPSEHIDCLVLGYRFDSIVRYGENPLDPQQAVFVIGRALIEVDVKGGDN